VSPEKAPGPSMDRRMLGAVLDGDQEEWKATSSSIEAVHFFQVLTVAATAAIFRKWPQDPSVQEIADYVAGMLAKIPGDAHVSPTVIEALIRGLLGEEEFLEGLPSQEVVSAALLLVQSIQREVLLTPLDRETYLAEILNAVD
jgi:hypothetical protein